MHKLIIEDIEIFAHHGYYPEEKKKGNVFLISVEIESNFEKAMQMDNLNDTINYEEIISIIKAEMHKSSNLIENLCYRIIESIVHKFGKIKKIKVKVSKLNPHLELKTKKVSFEIEKLFI